MFLFQFIPLFHPHLRIPCHTLRTPAAGCGANVAWQAGGMPFRLRRNVRQGLRGDGGPSAVRWRCRAPSGHEAKPATGEAPGSCAGSPPAAGSGMETGLWRTGLADAGRAVNVRAMPHSQRKTVVRAGTRKSGDAGLPLSGRPCGTGSLSVGCGHHPAKFGPRAWVRHRFIVFPEANPACGPPDPMLPSPHGGLIHPGLLAWAGGSGGQQVGAGCP